jgi:hypothetical protein
LVTGWWIGDEDIPVHGVVPGEDRVRKLRIGDMVVIEDYFDGDVCLVLEINKEINLVHVLNPRTQEIRGWGLDWVERKCEVIPGEQV